MERTAGRRKSRKQSIGIKSMIQVPRKINQIEWYGQKDAMWGRIMISLFFVSKKWRKITDFDAKIEKNALST